MEGREEVLLIQGSITVGDNLPSYQEVVCATNVCVVKPNSSFLRLPELKPLVCPQERFFVMAGHWYPELQHGGENKTERAEESSVTHISPLEHRRIWI